MADPLVIQVMRGFKRDLLRQEADQMRAMAQRWRQVEATLEDAVELFARRVIEDGLSEGQLRSRRFQLDRYASLLRQVRGELERYTDYAEPLITERQRTLGQAAIQQAATAIRAIGAENGVRIAFDVLSVDAIEFMVGLAGNGSPLRNLLVESYGAAADGMLTELIRATTLGKNPRETARRMVRNGLSQSLTRMLITARTEQMRVYREASRQAYQGSGVVEGHQRLATRDRRTCPACLMADGERMELDEPLREHPQGRCSTIPVVIGMEPVTWETGPDWFQRQSPDVQQEILGKGRFAAWQEGKFDLNQLVTVRSNPIWGDAVQPTPLRDLLAGNVVPVVIRQPAPVAIPEPAPEPQPLGTPVRNALEIPSRGRYKPKYEATLDAIEEVHGDGDLTTIPVKTKSNIKPFGYYQHLGDGTPDHIAVNGKGDHHELTLAHEIGHFLDHQGIAAPKRFASVGSDVMRDWRDTIMQSEAVQDLEAKLARPSDFETEVTYDGRTFTASPSVPFIRYLLDEKELWARSYAQYIATRSGNEAMLEQVETQRQAKLYESRQWSDEDFEPVAESIDRLFERLGWRR